MRKLKVLMPPIKKKKKTKSKIDVDLEEFAPNLEKYLKKNRKIDLRRFKKDV